MALIGQRTEIGMRHTGIKVVIPGNNTAKLMYYLNSICAVVEIDSNGDWRNLRDYKNWHMLDDDDIQKLLTICVLLDPDELTGKCIFEVPEDAIDSSNEFYELSANQTRFAAVANLVIEELREKRRREQERQKSSSCAIL